MDNITTINAPGSFSKHEIFCLIDFNEKYVMIFDFYFQMNKCINYKITLSQIMISNATQTKKHSGRMRTERGSGLTLEGG